MNKVLLAVIAFVLANDDATAREAKKVTPVLESEPIKCYEAAWGSKEKPGLGLNAGQAVTLCSGTTNASKTIQCLIGAWAHVDDGGLGLNAGQAVALCKSNSLP